MPNITINVEPQEERKFFILMHEVGTAEADDGRSLRMSLGGKYLMVNIDDRQYLIDLNDIANEVAEMDLAKRKELREKGEIE